MTIRINCIKAYDVRGQIPKELNVDIAYRIGNAMVKFLRAKRIVVGRDIRLSSEELMKAVSNGIYDAGAEVLDIGLSGTEMVYFGTSHLEADGGIMITASHNPADYNGLKLVKEDVRPISIDTGLREIRKLAESNERQLAKVRGVHTAVNIFDSYIEHILSYVDVSKLKPLKMVVNAGNGGAGSVIDSLESYLPFEFIKVHHEPDGTFPNGIPNPMLPENRSATIDAIKSHHADLGIAWDGDFDRCFLFDENGNFIEGYYIVGLLAESILSHNLGASIVHDPRLTWNTLDIVSEAGGEAVQSKSGHSFMKEKMREVDAIYGGEMSAHHYFRKFSYADSGMIPWLLVVELLSTTGKPLSALVDGCMAKYPVSGEINRKIDNPNSTLEALHQRYAGDALSVDDIDGYSFEFAEWRFNIRMSNTESFVRLNVESRGNVALMEAKTAEILGQLQENQ
ncbi:phosphomannomutase [Woeseiaceae bacterium]|nr:phosphomannomutase [Woeseiaceae bacterium]